MASKTKAGIPEGFTFDVPPVSDLGDYLDEQPPGRAAGKAGRAVADNLPPRSAPPPLRPSWNATGVVEAAQPAWRREPSAPVNSDPTVSPRSAHTPAAPEPTEPVKPHRLRPPRHTGPRREINMSPETLRMTDELLELVRGGSGQRDTTATELFAALVLLVYEAKDDVDLYTIPKRGRWGSPTARAYPRELKNAFLRAVRK